MSIGKTTELNVVNTEQLADKAITPAKIDSESAVENAVLTADGSGGASFQPAAGAADDFARVVAMGAI